MSKPRIIRGSRKGGNVKGSTFILKTIVWPNFGRPLLLETKIMFAKEPPLYTKASMLDSFTRSVLIARTVTDAYIGAELEREHQNATTLCFHKHRLIDDQVESETRNLLPDKRIVHLARNEEEDDHFTDITVTPDDDTLLHPFMVKQYQATKKPTIYRALRQEIDSPNLYVGMVLAIGKADAEATWERSIGHV